MIRGSLWGWIKRLWPALRSQRPGLWNSRATARAPAGGRPNLPARSPWLLLCRDSRSDAGGRPGKYIVYAEIFRPSRLTKHFGDQNHGGRARLAEYRYDFRNSAVQNTSLSTVHGCCESPIYRVCKAVWSSAIRKLKFSGDGAMFLSGCGATRDGQKSA